MDLDEEELACQDFVELCDGYLGGALTDQTRTRFDAHLADCPYCETYLKQLRLTIRAVGGITPPPVPHAAKAELMHLFRGRHREVTLS